MAKLTDLPLGKYCVKEKETANGYAFLMRIHFRI
ncbi:hypothetical protein [Blautia obeum]